MVTAMPDSQTRVNHPPAAHTGPVVPPAGAERTTLLDRVFRAAVVVLLVVISIVHLHLWIGGYRYIATIGPLFILDVIVAALLSVVVAVRLNLVIAFAAASFAAGTLGANVLSLLLPNGLFHFKEAGVSYSGGFAIASEVGVVALLSVWTYLDWRRPAH
jgi:hypothetical protein